MNRFKDVAIEAAKKAGSIHRKYFGSKFEIKKKKKSYDLVTLVDLKAEKAITDLIVKNFPSHNILAEENTYPTTPSEYKWIIDPLDGTNNFSHSLPIFCVSIALAKDDEVMLGVVYDPIKDELFLAERNKGSFLNGKKIQVSKVNRLNRSLLITGFYYDRGREMAETLKKIKEFFYRDIIGIRRFGSAALDLCNVACGRATGFWEFTLSPWDYAAGKLLVEEAGGRVTDRNGGQVKPGRSFIVASNGKIHNKMLDILT